MTVIIIGRAIQFILALVMLRVATTILSPEEMGRVSLVLTTIAFFSMFLINPVGMFINRRVNTWQAVGTARAYLKLYSGYLAGVSMVAGMALMLVSSVGLMDFGLSIGWLVLLACGSLVFNTINQTSIPLLNMLGDPRSFVSLSVATLVASFVIAVTLVLAFQASAHYWLLGVLVGQTLLAAIGTRTLFNRLGLNDSPAVSVDLRWQHFHVLYAFAWPVALAAGFGWVQGQGYRFVLESYLGMAQLGLFAAGYSISAGMIAGFESILTTYFQPRLYRDAAKDRPIEQAQAWRRYASAIIPALILTVVLIIMLAPEFTLLFLGKRFQGATDFVVWGALAEAARVLTGVYSLFAHVYMRTRWLIAPTATGAALSIFLSVLFIPWFGAEGAGVALALSGFFVVALLNILTVRRAVGSVLLPAIRQAIWPTVLLILAIQGSRIFFDNGDWLVVVSVVVIGGVIYLYSLYSLLRRHVYKVKET